MVPISEASPLLKIPVSTLRRLCARGAVPAEKVGQRWRIKGAYMASVTSWTPDPERRVA
jgi:excisionase family DNA binding protein